MKFLFALLTLVLSVTAAPLQFLDERGLPLPPSKDPFYTPDTGYESNPVGTILRHRKINNPFGILTKPAKIESAYQVLIRSEDTFGNANAITAAIYVPKNPDPSKLLSYQVAQDSSDLDCAPSYAFQLFSNPTALNSQVEELYVQAGLNQGWYVVVPDYEGPKAAFGAGHQAGKATLNGIRGALSSGNITGIDSDAKVTLWGYSGGSIATGWAALHQPKYAPELESNILGYAMGGIVADVEHTARKNMGDKYAGLLIAAISGLAHEYSELDEWINKNVFPDRMAEFKKVDEICEIVYLKTFKNAKWDYFFKTGDDTLNDPVVSKITKDLKMQESSETPTKPMFFYNSKNDEIIPAADADDWYNVLCERGVSVEYEQDLLGGHISQQLLGSGSAFVWIKDRFSGKTQTGCRRNFHKTNALTPEGIEGLGKIIVSAIYTYILKKPIGPYTLPFQNS
ncbi:Uncharacterized protein ABC855_g2674 [[Candida] zeylanoides]